MELGKISIYMGAIFVVLAVLFLIKIQIKNAKKSGVYGSLLNKLEEKEIKTLKNSSFLFVSGVILVIVGLNS